MFPPKKSAFCGQWNTKAHGTRSQLSQVVCGVSQQGIEVKKEFQFQFHYEYEIEWITLLNCTLQGMQGKNTYSTVLLEQRAQREFRPWEPP